MTIALNDWWKKIPEVKIPAWINQAVEKVAPAALVVVIVGSLLLGGIYLLEKKSPANPDNWGEVVEPVKSNDRTYYFKATGASWPLSQDAFLKKHPELKFIGASPDCSGIDGVQVGTFMYVDQT